MMADDRDARIAQLEAEVRRLRDEQAADRAEIAGLRDEQAATAEVLRVIASSPTDLQAALDAVAENAARLCGATDAVLHRVDGRVQRVVTIHGGTFQPMVGVAIPITPGHVAGRVVLEQRTIHIVDIAAEADTEFPVSKELGRQFGYRSFVCAPMIHQGVSIGSITLCRTEIRPFTEQQIALLETFADQAVIAIENARLFSELEERNRDLTETLEQQTATSEILKVISRSPTDLETVFDAIIRSGTRLCDGAIGVVYRFDGEQISIAAHDRLPADGLALLAQHFPRPLGGGQPIDRAIRDGVVVHVLDRQTDREYPQSPTSTVVVNRTYLAVPMLRDGTPIGALGVVRSEVRPFSERQIELMKTFADQAVIAIENARLFQELQESNASLREALEQQTALAEVLKVIASSPTNLRQVLDALITSAVRLCGAEDAAALAVDGDQVYPLATTTPEHMRVRYPVAGTVTGRVLAELRTIHVYGSPEEQLAQYPESPGARMGLGAQLNTPLLRGGQAIGVFALTRRDARPFTDTEIALFEAFADQAVIAIENARLFEELQQRNAELQESNRQVTESLERQTALSEVLRVIASSPTDVQHVLDTIAETAMRLCGAESGMIYRPRSRDNHLAACAAAGLAADLFRQMYGPDLFEHDLGVEISHDSLGGQVFLTGQTIAVSNASETVRVQYPGSAANQARNAYRSAIVIPLMQGGTAIGVLTVTHHAEDRPFTEQQVALLEAFADQAVIAIANARLFEELQDRTAELARAVEQQRALGEIGRAVSSSLDLEQVLATIVANAVRLSGAAGGVIYEYDDAAGELQVRATTTLDPDVEAALRSDPPHIGVGRTGRAAVVRGPVQREDLLDGEIVPTAVGRLLLERGYRSLLSVPILRDDQVLGAVTVGRTVPGAFPPEVVALLQTFATQSALAIDNARLYRALEEASRHKSAFLANMSHELRTPLNAVIGYSEMLQEELEDLGQADLVPDVERINTAGRHLLGLINDILDLSKIEAGRMELFLEPVDVDRLVREVATTVGPLVEKNGNVLEVDAAPDLGEVRADATKLRQIMFNLLGNAAKFTDHGTIRLTATREAAPAGDWLTFAVADTGIGMTEEQRGRLFRAFVQADASTSRRFGGTGLGLALVHSFCEMLGGGVTVASAPGAGSTFTVRLPADASAARPGSSNTDDPSTDASAATVGSGPAVLVIDDDAASRDLLRRHLAAEGVRVILAASGEEGLRLARDLRPAVVTLDVLMPGLDGWAVLAALKGDPATADIPVIMLTMLDDRDLGYSLGAADYLVKPIDRERLLAAVRKHARAADVRRALVIEDDPATREMLRRTLEREGWAVQEAADGRVGLERVAASFPDLVLLDLLMPGLDGFGFVERLRAEPAWRAIPVLVVTAKDLTAEERARLNGRVEQVLRKGAYSRDELLARVRAAVRASVEATD